MSKDYIYYGNERYVQDLTLSNDSVDNQLNTSHHLMCMVKFRNLEKYDEIEGTIEVYGYIKYGHLSSDNGIKIHSIPIGEDISFDVVTYDQIKLISRVPCDIEVHLTNIKEEYIKMNLYHQYGEYATFRTTCENISILSKPINFMDYLILQELKEIKSKLDD